MEFVALAEKARHSEVAHLPTGFESALPIERGLQLNSFDTDTGSYHLGGLDQVVLTRLDGGLGKINLASRPPPFDHLGGSHDALLLTQEQELLTSS